MEGENRADQSCVVHPILIPAGPDKERRYSDIALTGLFSAHITLFTQEVQWFWRHYHLMLLANSLIFGFFLNLKDPNPSLACFGLLFGLAFCYLWWKMARTASEYQDIWQEAAQRFSWPDFDTGGRPSNPIAYAMERRGELVQNKNWRIKRHRIRIMSWWVILLFAFGYVFLFIKYIA